MTGFKMPDLTPAQIVSIVGSIIAVLVAGGLDISDELQNAIIGLTGVLASVLLVGDAVIRNGRSKIAAEQVKVNAAAASSDANDNAGQAEAKPASYPED